MNEPTTNTSALIHLGVLSLVLLIIVLLCIRLIVKTLRLSENAADKAGLAGSRATDAQNIDAQHTSITPPLGASRYASTVQKTVQEKGGAQ